MISCIVSTFLKFVSLTLNQAKKFLKYLDVDAHVI